MKNELNVAIVQSQLHWENIEANLAMFEEKIWGIKSNPDLVLLPEMFTTGFTMDVARLAEPVNSKTFRWMKQQAAQFKAIIVGSYMVVANGNYYNRLYAVFPDGSSKYYDKRHLFGLAGEGKDFSSGTDRMTFECCGWKVMPLVCYDLRFPVWARSRKSDDLLYEYDLLVFAANWPKPRINAWDTLLAARAIENTAYCAGGNRVGTDGAGAEYVGHSSVYNYKGEAVQTLGGGEEGVVSATLFADELNSFRERFPFQKDSDLFHIAE